MPGVPSSAPAMLEDRGPDANICEGVSRLYRRVAWFYGLDGR